MSDWPCVAASADGTVLTVGVMPNARRTEAVGLHDGALRVRLAAAPIEGRANDALIKWLSRELGVPQRDIVLHHGAAGRRKRLAIPLPPQRVTAWLDSLGI